MSSKWFAFSWLAILVVFHCCLYLVFRINKYIFLYVVLRRSFIKEIVVCMSMVEFYIYNFAISLVVLFVMGVIWNLRAKKKGGMSGWWKYYSYIFIVVMAWPIWHLDFVLFQIIGKLVGRSVFIIYVYDFTFLIVFSLCVTLFLKSNKDNLGREGWIFMYRTQLGVKAMDWFDRKFHRVLGALRHVIVALGFLLMAAMIWLLGQSVWIYISRPEIVEVVKAPPIAPLIPYFPELFGLQSVFPPFYFTYFLAALAIVAVVHEFSHGIFMRYSKTKIKSTGLVFLGPILGAFVEEDRNSFHSKNRLNQMSVLGAGVFANTLFAFLFYLLYVGFFYLAFTSSGFVFNSYGMAAVNSSVIDGSYEQGNYTVLIVGEKNYFMDDSLLFQLEEDKDIVLAYENTPAFNSQLFGVIVGIDEYEIVDMNSFVEALVSFSPGDNVTIHTKTQGEEYEFDLTLGEHPMEEGKAYLGVGYYGNEPRGVVQKFLASFIGFKSGSTFYEPVGNEVVTDFIYDFIWWVMIINLLVALFNMLPLGILDGGRFFYLAVEKFTGEKVAKKAFSWATKFILFIFVLLMAVYMYRII